LKEFNAVGTSLPFSEEVIAKGADSILSALLDLLNSDAKQFRYFSIIFFVIFILIRFPMIFLIFSSEWRHSHFDLVSVAHMSLSLGRAPAPSPLLLSSSLSCGHSSPSSF